MSLFRAKHENTLERGKRKGSVSSLVLAETQDALDFCAHDAGRGSRGAENPVSRVKKAEHGGGAQLDDSKHLK